MVGLIILGSIVLILLILLFSPLRFCIEYLGGKPKVVLRYFFFRKTLVGGAEKPKKQKTAKKSKKKKADKKETEDRESKSGLLPDTVGGKIDFVLELVKSGGRALRKLLRRIKIKDIVIDFTVSDEDAYECAIKFGKMNIIVYNALTVLGYFLRLRKKRINIKCVYNQPKCIYDASCKVCVTPAALIAIAVGFGWAFLKLVIKTKKQAKLNKMQSEEKPSEREESKDKQAA